MANTGVYARQSVKVDEGIEQQIQACQEDIDRRKDLHLIDTYIDNNTSASKDRGPTSDWARMLRDIDAGRIDTVIVVAVDRLLRRLVDVIELTSRNVRIITVRGSIDTNEAFGKFILSLFVLVAEQEIETKKERNLPYKLDRHSKGTPTPGMAPHGYRWIPKIERETRKSDRRYELVEDQKLDVRFIFDELLRTDEKTVSLGTICRELNVKGRTTRKGAQWGSSTVWRMALSPFYAGLLPQLTTEDVHYNPAAVDLNTCIKGDWDAIVTVDELRAVRTILLNPERRKNGGKVARKWLLSGHARCGALTGPRVDDVQPVCGLDVRSARPNTGQHGYRCPKGHFLRAGDILDEYVTEAMIERLSQPDAASLIQQSPTVDVPGLRARETTLEGRAIELLTLVESGAYSASDVIPMKAKIDTELVEIRSALAEVARIDPVAEIASVADVRAKWSELSLARKQAIIEALVIVVMHPVGKGKRVLTLVDAERTTTLAWRHNRADGVVNGTIQWSHPLPVTTVQELALQLS